MKILVTGGCGFIGSNFVHYWLNTHPKDKIINLDKLTYAGNPANLVSFQGNSRYSFVKGDITDAKIVSKVMTGADVVVHFAAESHVDRSITGPAVFVKTNVIGTQVLLDTALSQKIKKFHHVSTDEVFGSLALASKNKFDEKTPFAPNSPYAASKAGSDCLVRAYFKTYGLPVTVTNCSNNFGPYQFPEKLIPLAITNLITGKKVPVYGDGLYIRDWLYVEDHCRAIEKVLEEGKIGETYCVGGLTYDINNLEIIRMILKLLKKDDSSIEFVKDRPGHDRRYAVDWRKIKKDLGWKPQFDFGTWLVKTVVWYQKNERWWRPLKKEEEKHYAKTR